MNTRIATTDNVVSIKCTHKFLFLDSCSFFLDTQNCQVSKLLCSECAMYGMWLTVFINWDEPHSSKTAMYTCVCICSHICVFLVATYHKL